MASKPAALNRSAIPISLFLLLVAGLLYWFGETWLRHLLLYLSTAGWARNLVSSLPVAKQVARRFVAGETLDEAVSVTRELNRRGMRVTLDYLGESVTNTSDAETAREEILRLLDRIAEEGLNASVSVKLTQLGLKIDTELAYENIRAIVAKAKGHNNCVRIDMEDSPVVDITLDFYRRLRFDEGCNNVGVVIQSYLYRSEADVIALTEKGASVRLCKGAYMEPATVAFPSKSDTDNNFVHLMRLLLDEKARQNGVYLGVATHDDKMIEATKLYAQQEGISPEEYEFQMLYGVRREKQESLINQGYNMRVYVPYGTAWYPYFVRRLAERPANLWFFLSNLFRG